MRFRKTFFKKDAVAFDFAGVFEKLWFGISAKTKFGNKKSIEMAQTDPFLPFLIFTQTKNDENRVFFSHYASFHG